MGCGDYVSKESYPVVAHPNCTNGVIREESSRVKCNREEAALNAMNCLGLLTISHQPGCGKDARHRRRRAFKAAMRACGFTWGRGRHWLDPGKAQVDPQKVEVDYGSGSWRVQYREGGPLVTAGRKSRWTLESPGGLPGTVGWYFTASQATRKGLVFDRRHRGDCFSLENASRCRAKRRFRYGGPRTGWLLFSLSLENAIPCFGGSRSVAWIV